MTLIAHIAVLLALAAGPNAEPVRRTDKLLQRIIGTIRDRCHQWDLTPGSVALSHGISKRYLHYLFARANTTFGSELMRLRLEGARRFHKAFGQGPLQFRANCSLAGD